MKMRWETDIYLSEIAKQIDEKDVISFDIFDTLLFRTVAMPEHIFVEVGKRLQKAFPNRYDFPPEVFAGMRREADAQARKKAWETDGVEEITLDHIYKEFHLDDDYVASAKECELAAERGSVYLNPNIVDFMYYCRNQGKKLALLSDSYLSKGQIQDLLSEGGFDLSIISAFIVSSEYGVLKYNGKLFQRLADAYPDTPKSRILHIGDNPHADIDGAACVGIQAAYYGVIPQNMLHFMSVERNHFGCRLDTVASLRKLAISSVPQEYRQPEEQFFFNTGCSIFGVVYTFFSEWILEQAKKEGINTIIAFMREGELLSEMINRAAKNQKLDMKIMPIYISRRTTEIVRIGNIDDRVINEYLNRPLLKVEELFSIFYLEVEQSPCREIREFTIERCKTEGSFNELSAYFKSERILREINHRVTWQKELLAEYIQSVTGGNDAITVDIGFRGTMQDCLSRMKANGKGRLLHLILMGIPYNNRFLLDGTRIRGWLGYGDENLHLIEKIYRRIQMPEAITNADVGTTIAYNKEDGEINAVLEPVSIDDLNKHKKSILWNGIFHFQDCWFMLQEKKNDILSNILEQKEDFLYILLRILTMPTYEEALHLGQLYYDESMLNSVKATICKPNDFTMFDESTSVKDFIDKCESGMYNEPVYWPEGIVANRLPMCFRKNYLDMLPNSSYKKVCQFLLDEKLYGSRIAVYGAGKKGREFLAIARDVGLIISFVVDADPHLQGTCIAGIHVISPKKSVNIVDAYIITPVGYEKEIRETFDKLYLGFEKKPYVLLY